MSDLDGSDRSVPWAARVRYQLLAAAYDRHVTEQNMSGSDYEARARCVTPASWWIHQRDTDPTDIEELLIDIAADAAARTQENPY
jgi:hypothetical protein